MPNYAEFTPLLSHSALPFTIQPSSVIPHPLFSPTSNLGNFKLSGYLKQIR